VRLALKLLLITIAAILVDYVAISTVNINGIYSSGTPDIDRIKQRCPVRLVQPEWVNPGWDLIINWTVAEIKARIGLVSMLWLCGMAVIIYRTRRRSLP
jgi:hypothetical protein